MAGNTPAELITAIECANANGTADDIDLNGQTVTLTDSVVNYFGATGLPRITTNITIRNGTITRSGANEFRLFYVASVGNFTLSDMTLTSGGGADYTASGGGIHNVGSLTITNSTLSGNSAGSGGAIYNGSSLSSLTITNSTLSANSATYGGGIDNFGTLTITNSTLSGNSAGNGGGGIFTFFGSMTITNSTLSGNSAGSGGGGIYNDGLLMTITNSTLSGNSAGDSGGGIANDGALIITNSVLWGNSSNDISAATVIYSIVEGGFAGTGNLNADPLFVDPVAFASAPTSAGNYRLQDGSPAIDAGSNSAVPVGVTTDRDGNPRRYDDTGVADTGTGTAPIVDMGAYEKQTNTPDACAAITFPYIMAGNTPAELITAIECANANGMADEIDLNGQTVTLTDSFDNYAGATGLPHITTNITIRNGTITRSGANEFRLFYVNASGSFTLSDMTLTNGGGADYTASGGGMLNFGTLTITSSTLSGNIANSGGGGIVNGGTGTLTITNSTLSGNSATYGGGIANVGTLTITNSTVSGNNATYQGGGIANVGPLTITNSTLSGNSAGDSGGGIANDGTLTVTNSVLWGNSSNAITGATVTYSVVEGGFAGTGNLNADPLFVDPVASASAPTSAGNYRLQDGSPAIDAGSNSAVPGGVTTDRDGNPRRYDDTGVADTGTGTAPIVDMGAYEKQTNTPLPVSLLKNGGFETAGDKPQTARKWKVNAPALTDKRICKPQVAFEGNCAYRFHFNGTIVGNGDKRAIVQKILAPGVDEGDALDFRLYASTAGMTASSRARVIVKYGDGGKQKIKLNIPAGTSPYTLYAGSAVLTGTPVSITVTIEPRASSGKMFVDSASLMATAGAGLGRTADILPLPQPPEGFRR